MDSHRTNAGSALFVTFVVLTYSRRVVASIESTYKEEHITSMSRYSSDCGQYACGIFGAITSLYVYFCVIGSFRDRPVEDGVCLGCGCRIR